MRTKKIPKFPQIFDQSKNNKTCQKKNKIALNSGQYHVPLVSQNLAKHPKASRGFLHLSERSFIIMLLLGLAQSYTSGNSHTMFHSILHRNTQLQKQCETVQKSQNLQCHRLSAWLTILEEEDIRSNVKELKILKSAMPSYLHNWPFQKKTW